MGKKDKRKGVVYSTDSGYNYKYEEQQEEETLPNNLQKLRVFIEKKGRGGKTATIVKGFTGSSEDLQELARTLKNKCATGGSSKAGEIILQGDVRDKVVGFLVEQGYPAKKAGG
jgi:translation initiation factor 1